MGFDHHLEKLLAAFDIDGQLVDLTEHKRGHINTTWIGTWRSNSGNTRYIHQKVNHHVFRDVGGLMRNMQKVTHHLRGKNASIDKSCPRDVTLTIVPTKEGSAVVLDSRGDYWRSFEYIENTTSYDVCPHPSAARESAAILGRFQRDLFDLDTHSLIETIPGFHNAPLRFDTLEDAILRDVHGRAGSCREEIEFGRSGLPVAGLLVEALRTGASNLRVTHNDMKLNNVLFDADGRHALALVDLDTCMPGSVLFDFGDFARNTSVPTAEDEQDHSKIQVDLTLFEEITKGYLDAVGETLTSRELELLVVSPRVLALTLGVRFLTDHLLGDTYFKIHRAGQNLDRARAQFVVAERFRQAQGDLEEILAAAARR